MKPSPIGPRLSALLVDPSLFTAPYDAALSRGLLAAGVVTEWAARDARPGDRDELDSQDVAVPFYRTAERLSLPKPIRAVFKGLSHIVGLGRLVRRVYAQRPQVVHFQWTVLPVLDGLAFRLVRRRCPVVLTVHDTVPFNGDNTAFLQRAAFEGPLRQADALIVHTRGGKEALITRGVPAGKVSVIPHGPLTLPGCESLPPPNKAKDRPARLLCFGEIKPYKGVDVLIEAVGGLPIELRRRSRFVVAGRPRMDLSPLIARIAELGIESVFEFLPRRLSEQEMAEQFAQTDCFVFPYRQIDASGVYFLTKSLGRWLIASRVGIFAEDLADGVAGRLVPVGDVAALRDALAHFIEHRPLPPTTHGGTSSWEAIGLATRDLYERVQAR